MLKRYLIGINFGPEKTTASYVDMESMSEPTALHIIGNPSTDRDTDRDKVESCICKDKDTGEWRLTEGFEYNSPPYVRCGLKLPINEISESDQEAIGAFTKLIFSKIRKNQPFLIFDSDTGVRNFELCIAVPSIWNDSQIFEYLHFIQRFIPVSWLMKENDAAYFNLRDNDCVGKSVLFIDVGENKIHSTYYDVAGNVKDIFNYPQGVSQIELAVLDYLHDHDETFREYEKNILSLLGDDNERNRNYLRTKLRKYIGGQIEDFYTSASKCVSLDLPSRILVASGQGFILNCDIDKETLEDNILKEYKANLRNEFSRVAMQVYPQVVFVTGETLRVPWLAHLIRDVFSEANPNVKVYKYFNTGHKVSHGMVKYALGGAKEDKRIPPIRIYE